MKTLLILFVFLFSTSVFGKEFKPYLCNWYTSDLIKKDQCKGTNSWYKVYFPELYPTKKSCMENSNDLFNNELIMAMFPDYKKPGDEMSSWVAGCDTLWSNLIKNEKSIVNILQSLPSPSLYQQKISSPYD